MVVLQKKPKKTKQTKKQTDDFCESTFIPGLGKNISSLILESWICWEPNFVVYQTHENHQSWHSTIKNTFIEKKIQKQLPTSEPFL